MYPNAPAHALPSPKACARTLRGRPLRPERKAHHLLSPPTPHRPLILLLRRSDPRAGHAVPAIRGEAHSALLQCWVREVQAYVMSPKGVPVTCLQHDPELCTCQTQMALTARGAHLPARVMCAFVSAEGGG